MFSIWLFIFSPTEFILNNLSLRSLELFHVFAGANVETGEISAQMVDLVYREIG